MTQASLVLMQQGRVVNLAFLKQDFEIVAFLNTFGYFLEINKSRTKSGFFRLERLGSGKTLSELHIRYKSLRKNL